MKKGDEHVNPDVNWYSGISQSKGLAPRCPFASVHRCPRFYQSLSLLRNAGFTEIDPKQDKALLERWRQSDLWPAIAEQATCTFGGGETVHSFSCFCPEVSFECWGLFASDLHRYVDETDRDIAHAALAKRGAKGEDWRWHWWTISPMHYSECPLYSPLLHDSTRPRTAAPPAPKAQEEILEVKPTLYGIKINVNALWTLITDWLRRRRTQRPG
jgi:hypothetical protein